jgi:hypothetical protein
LREAKLQLKFITPLTLPELIMTYKEIVLKLLKSRENLVCLEEHLMNDFRDFGNPGENFNDWCERNNIVSTKVSAEDPAKILLKKKVFILD